MGPTHNHSFNSQQKVKGHAIPLQTWTTPRGSQEIEANRFHKNWHMNVVRLSDLRTGNIPGNHFS